MTPEGLVRLKLDEACELQAYPDADSPLGQACTRQGLRLRSYRQVANWAVLSGDPWTIGYGHTGPEVHEGLVWTQAQADAQLLLDVAKAEQGIGHRLPWFAQLAPVRQDVLTNIAFNVGVGGLMKWPVTLGHFEAGKFACAANDLLTEGPWDAQVGDRAKRLSRAVLTCTWSTVAADYGQDLTAAAIGG